MKVLKRMISAGGKVELSMVGFPCRNGLQCALKAAVFGSVKTAVVIPVLNQLTYTQGCLRCLEADIAAGTQVVVVDNGSTDQTPDWLRNRSDITVISNEENRGCATAWNQGCKAAATADWIVVLNNDVLLPSGWLVGLLGAARRERLDIVSPAMRERDLNYPFPEYAADFMTAMSGVARQGAAHGVCFAVHRSVFDRVGGFDEAFRIGQFEDSDFFRRAKLAGFRMGTVGACFIHHFGSVTQDALRSGPTVRPYEAENRAYFRKKWRIGWFRRRWEKYLSKRRLAHWRKAELEAHGRTLHEKWDGSGWRAY